MEGKEGEYGTVLSRYRLEGLHLDGPVRPLRGLAVDRYRWEGWPLFNLIEAIQGVEEVFERVHYILYVFEALYGQLFVKVVDVERAYLPHVHSLKERDVGFVLIALERPGIAVRKIPLVCLIFLVLVPRFYPGLEEERRYVGLDVLARIEDVVVYLVADGLEDPRRPCPRVEGMILPVGKYTKPAVPFVMEVYVILPRVSKTGGTTEGVTDELAGALGALLFSANLACHR